MSGGYHWRMNWQDLGLIAVGVLAFAIVVAVLFLVVRRFLRHSN
jgi:hypothetical protein